MSRVRRVHLGLTLILLAPSALAARPPRASGHTVVQTADGGWLCTSIVDVGIDGCQVSRAVYEGERGRALSYRTPCGQELDACGATMLCDCTAAWADAGLLLPDGGECRATVRRLRDGGLELDDPCNAAYKLLRPGSGSDFPITPLPKPRRAP